jgi:diadenosine tetraphosphate (Ap4A) HIT family hydrolase
VFELHPQLEKDTIFLHDFPFSRLLLLNDSTYPWLVLVPRVPELRDLVDIALTDEAQFCRESRWVSLFLRETFQPDKLNVASLGNMVPQLHVHHIARFRSDAAWPAPVWGKVAMQPYSEAEVESVKTKWQRWWQQQDKGA